MSPLPNPNDFQIPLTNERDPEKNILVDENALLAEQRIWKQYIYIRHIETNETYLRHVGEGSGVRRARCQCDRWLTAMTQPASSHLQYNTVTVGLFRLPAAA